MPGTGEKLATSYLLFKEGGYYVSADGVLNSIEFDLLLDEQHSLEAEVTQHTVDDGSTISDHIRNLPRKGSLTGFVTNHPFRTGYNGGLDSRIAQKIAANQKKDWVSGFVQDLGSSYTRVGQILGQQDATQFTAADFIEGSPDRVDRVSNAWSAFKALMKAKTTCTIQTGLEKYMDVVVTKVGTDRDKDTGDAGRFKVEFQEIKFAVLSEIALSNVTRPDFKTDAGKQATNKKKGGKTGGRATRVEDKFTAIENSTAGKQYGLNKVVMVNGKPTVVPR